MNECISAPIAESENDSISDCEKSNREPISEIKIRRSYSDPMDISLESTISLSLEDLISTFDEKIYKCFQDLGTDTAQIAPVCVKNELLKENDWGNYTWTEESERYINDTKSIKENSNGFSLENNNRLVFAYCGHDSQSLKSAEGLLLEIHEMMDYNDNNADFEGIAESFYDSDLSESVKDVVVAFQDNWLNKEGTAEWQRALQSLSVDALKLISNDMKAQVRTLSDCLLIHLATRDELEFEREVRDRFMLLLQGVQRKKREFARNLVTQRHNAAQLRKNRGSSRWSWNGNWGTLFRHQKMQGMVPDSQVMFLERKDNDNNNNNNNNNNNTKDVFRNSVRNIKTRKFILNDEFSSFHSGSFKCSKSQMETKSLSLDATLKYLSTTIPFNPGVSSINVHHLQIFNKILLAILQENSKLDNFLTEYILNVYTPYVDNRSALTAINSCIATQ